MRKKKKKKREEAIMAGGKKKHQTNESGFSHPPGGAEGALTYHSWIREAAEKKRKHQSGTVPALRTLQGQIDRKE